MIEKNLEFETLKAYNSAVVAKEFVKALEKAKETISFMVKAANSFFIMKDWLQK